jgi:peptidoglycan/LPS O-acetylase OafA/YrhL
MRKNLALLQQNRSKRFLTTIDGIKALASIWMVVGFTYLSALGLTTGPAGGVKIVDNINSAEKAIVENGFFQMISSSSFAYDTFYTISGFLMSFVAMKKLRAHRKITGVRPRKGFTILKLFVYKYLYLTVMFLLILCFYIGMFGRWGMGPLGIWTDLLSGCDNWWLNIFYVSNVIVSDR